MLTTGYFRLGASAPRTKQRESYPIPRRQKVPPLSGEAPPPLPGAFRSRIAGGFIKA